jgi:acid phosphatase type 7
MNGLRGPSALLLILSASIARADSAPGPPLLRLDVGPYVAHAGTTTATIRVEADVAPVLKVSMPRTPAVPQVPKAEPVQIAGGTRTLFTYTVTGLEPGKEQSYWLTDKRGARIDGKFRTAPIDDVPFSFLIYGDNRTDDAAHVRVAKAMESAPGDFLLNTGDLVEEGSKREDWLSFFRAEHTLLQERTVYSTIGNHELYQNGGVEYAQYFGDLAGLRENPIFFNSTFRWASARFFLLNSMTSFSGTKDRAWLEQAFEKAKDETGVRFRFVVMHHGLYSSGPHGNNVRMIQAGIPELFRKYDVDAIFAGHDHIYERGTEDSMRYVVSGGGGAPSYEIKKPLAGMKKADPVRHFIEAKIKGDEFSMTVRKDTGTEIESCSFSKGTKGWACDVTAAPPAAGSASSSPTPIAPVAPVTPVKSGCSCAMGASSSGASGLGVYSLLFLLTRRSSVSRLSMRR